MMSKSIDSVKVSKVLKYLIDGHIIRTKWGEEFDETDFVLDSDGNLCIKGQKLVDPKDCSPPTQMSESNTVLMKINFGEVSVRSFISWANEIPSKTMDVISANVALNNLKASGAKIRTSL